MEQCQARLDGSDSQRLARSRGVAPRSKRASERPLSDFSWHLLSYTSSSRAFNTLFLIDEN